MTGAFLALALLTVPPASAAGKAQKPRSLEGIVALALEHGREEELSAGTAEKLGLGAAALPLKKTRYKQSASPDRKEHALAVAYRTDDNGGRTPLHLLFIVGSSKKQDGPRLVDVLGYRTDLKGKLKACIRTFGSLNDVRQESLPIDDAAQKGLRSELEFHRRVAPSLGLQPAQ